jgi:hypothetical protein
LFVPRRAIRLRQIADLREPLTLAKAPQFDIIISTKPGEYQTTFPKTVIWPFTELIAHHIASMNTVFISPL